jgi:dolichol-phosphate mannosyltransferase
MLKIGKKSGSTLVILATLNEEKGLGPTLTEIENHLAYPLVLVVDGRSTDQTVKVAESRGAQVIYQKGLGKGDAIATAIEHTNGLNIKYVMFIDADFTYPAEYAAMMIDVLEKNPEVGMVAGNRFSSQMQSEAMANKFYLGNRLLSFTHRLVNGVRMKDPLTGLRVVRSEIVKNWVPRSMGFDIEVELNHLVENSGFSIREIPIQYRCRLGEKKLKPKHGFTIFKRIMLERLQTLGF